MEDKFFTGYEWIQNKNKVRILRVILVLLTAVPIVVIPCFIKDIGEWMCEASKVVYRVLKEEWNRERNAKNAQQPS